jgi:hypothetical protein
MSAELEEIRELLLELRDRQRASLASLRTLIAVLPSQPSHLETRRQP